MTTFTCHSCSHLVNDYKHDKYIIRLFDEGWHNIMGVGKTSQGTHDVMPELA